MIGADLLLKYFLAVTFQFVSSVPDPCLGHCVPHMDYIFLSEQQEDPQVAPESRVWKQVSAFRAIACRTLSETRSLVLTAAVTLQIGINPYPSDALLRLLTFSCSATNETKIINNCSYLRVTNVIWLGRQEHRQANPALWR